MAKRSNEPIIQKPWEIVEHRKAGKLAADTLVMISEYIQPGVSTQKLNDLVHEYTLSHGATPAPLHYGGTTGRASFPRSICTSINDVVCHGIPSEKDILRDGDIINVDITSIYPKRMGKKGWYGDTSATFYVGEPAPLTKHLVEVTRQCLELGIQQVKPGTTLRDIGLVIQQFAESKGCSIVREYTGHGIGRVFHGLPQVFHYVADNEPALRFQQQMKLREGMTFTIEPMINLHGPEIDHLSDGWTVVTKDGSMSAQFEHTIVVTKDGCEVLTRRDSILKNSEDKSWSKLGHLSSFIS